LSAEFVGGMGRTPPGQTRVPTKFGVEPLHEETQPGVEPFSSTASLESRPMLGVPHTWMLSLVWSGPLMLSAEMKLISVQLEPRWARYLLQFAAAYAWSVDVAYASGSSVSKSVK
jgi:hypothetical protein